MGEGLPVDCVKERGISGGDNRAVIAVADDDIVGPEVAIGRTVVHGDGTRPKIDVETASGAVEEKPRVGVVGERVAALKIDPTDVPLGEANVVGHMIPSSSLITGGGMSRDADRLVPHQPEDEIDIMDRGVERSQEPFRIVEMVRCQSAGGDEARSAHFSIVHRASRVEVGAIKTFAVPDHYDLLRILISKGSNGSRIDRMVGEGFLNQHVLVMFQSQLDERTMTFCGCADDDRIDLIIRHQGCGVSRGDSGKILLRERDMFGFEIANKFRSAISQARKFVEMMSSVVSDADKTESDGHEFLMGAWLA